MRRVDSDSDSSSSAFSSDDDLRPNNSTGSSQQFFAKLVRDTRSKVEQKKSEINATMQEKLPEWKQRGAMYSKQAKDTSMEWSRRGKEAVDRWKSADGDRHSDNAVFGMPLEVATALTKIEIKDLIPAVFKRCIDYLNDVGVHEVGIYRIPGSTITVNKLRTTFNDGSDIDFHITKPDPHAVGTLLKMYLRELPEPIIPFALSDEYTQQFTKYNTMDTTHGLPPMSPCLLKAMRSITSRLPINNFALLQTLCRHLKKVADHEAENRMSVSNLAVIFIPTLNTSRLLFHCMIEHYQQLFESNTPPPLPQKPRNLSMDGEKRKIVHHKTMSDTGLLTHATLQAKPKIPPPKPSRATSATKPPVKPRSKSLSSPKANLCLTTQHDMAWQTRGRVEQVGRQFETMMLANNNNKKQGQ